MHQLLFKNNKKIHLWLKSLIDPYFLSYLHLSEILSCSSYSASDIHKFAHFMRRLQLHLIALILNKLLACRNLWETASSFLAVRRNYRIKAQSECWTWTSLALTVATGQQSIAGNNRKSDIWSFIWSASFYFFL